MRCVWRLISKLPVGRKTAVIAVYIISVAVFPLKDIAIATTAVVQEQEPKSRIITWPSESLVIKKSARDMLLSSMTAGVSAVADLNPYLDSTHKADGYTQELLDMRFKYPLGDTTSNFGFNVTNINYYEATDLNTFDGLANLNFERRFFDYFTLKAGYLFETMWYPNDRNGTYVGNEIMTSVTHNFTDRVYESCAYRLYLKNYINRKARLGNMNLGSNLRRDMKNTFEHELGAFITKATKLRITNQFLFNESNDQFNDFYDYFSYRVGGSLIQIFTKKFYNTTSFYYKRKNYDERRCTDKQKEQRDNLYTFGTTFLYDISKKMSIYVSYAHMENHSNEPLERYTDNLYTAGLYLSF